MRNFLRIHLKRNQNGTILDILSVFIMVIALSVLMIGYLNTMRLLQQKEDINQIARKYILRMETIGYLKNADRVELVQDLTALGITEIDLTGTTLADVGYGNPITLSIQGNIKGQELNNGDILNILFEHKEYPFIHKKMSTAKN